MEFQFDKLVNSLLNEGMPQPNPPSDGPEWRQREFENPQAGYGDRNAGLRSRERNFAKPTRMALKITWAKSGKADYLRNKETKEPIVFTDSQESAMLKKGEQLKSKGMITKFEVVAV